MMEHQSYLLAAGRGERAGGPKAWADCGGKTLLGRQAEFLLGLFRPEDIAVAVQPGWLDRCKALDGRIRWVGVDPDAPSMASLQALLAASPVRRWGFVHHVDMPVWDRGLFELLAGSLPDPSSLDALVCAHRGRRGHPAVISARAQAALLALDPATGRLDRWLDGASAATVDVPHACALENWNHGVP
ncbi:MAG: nucleotidyltransferase family protein [Elusimicrobia bacterium]|nr:nucleotidyltransferase family protein [Elusimicrobiota bacterium]